MEKSASHKHPVCKRVLLEKKDVQEFLEKHPQKEHAAHIPEGAKVAKDAKPKPVQHDTTSVAPNEYPYNVIGKLFFGGESFDRENPDGSVTAALVGPNIIVTAASQIPFDTAGLWLRFVPGFNDGNEPFGSAFVINSYGYLDSSATTNYNYVVMELDTPLGSTCGWLGTYANQSSAEYLEYQNWNTVGYPVQAPILLQKLLIERDDVGGEANRKDFFAKQDFTVADQPGWYGAPMFGTPLDENGGSYVIGVVSGNFEYEGTSYIVYAGGEDLLSIVRWAYENYS
ncbi:hypothetical protein V8E51_008335 [Hyaloscypha variabilis]|jgi:V8-like Glu-specific endopeptidase|uniref:Uncharacterized protein n=1 Tax=Hyaloscypha variabilis (strain UAMH 11265 / GT02V1 / F) TaxID=1149755 RepID=A0A2J6S142_HYAVF|nr:hypothetical protein L207DRAFT_619579 [Hyaloscypha variabilis F]